MGQSSINPYNGGGGGGGTNYWKLVPLNAHDAVLTPVASAGGFNIVAVNMLFGQFEFYIDDTNIYMQANDSAGNSAVLQIPDTGDILMTVQDVSGTYSNFLVQLLNVEGTVTPIAGGGASIAVTDTLIQASIGDLAGNKATIDIQSTQIEEVVQSPSGADQAGALYTLAQVSVGIRNLPTGKESLFVAFPSDLLMYVRDAGGNVGQLAQTLINLESQYNGATVFENNVDGFIYYDEFTPGAGAYVGYSGILQLKDIGGTIYQIPYL